MDLVFHAVSESVLRKADCLHIFATLRIVVPFRVKYDVRIIFFRSDVNFVIPEIQRNKRHAKFPLKVSNNILTKFLKFDTGIIALLFTNEFSQILFDTALVDHPGNNSMIALMHEGNIINLVHVCPHGVHDLIEIYDLGEDVIVLVDHN